MDSQTNKLIGAVEKEEPYRRTVSRGKSLVDNDLFVDFEEISEEEPIDWDNLPTRTELVRDYNGKTYHISNETEARNYIETAWPKYKNELGGTPAESKLTAAYRLYIEAADSYDSEKGPVSDELTKILHKILNEYRNSARK